MRKQRESNIKLAFALLFLVFLVGVCWFRFYSGYSWVDAVYMTIITVTTVGFKEVQPLNETEKVFTTMLVITSIFVFSYAIKVITENILSKNNVGNFKKNKVKKIIDSLEGHVIVCGYGRNGMQVTAKLKDYNQEYVVIESNKDVIAEHSQSEVLFVAGDAVDENTLRKAGIERAETIICALPSDADNLFIVLSARQIKPDLKIISRATEETSLKKLKLAGADNVVLPDKIGGDHMANLVVTPDLVEFLDNLSVSGERDSINVEQVPFSKISPQGKEESIAALDIRKKTGCSIIGYKAPNGEYIVNPEPSMVIKKNSRLILIGRPDQIKNLKERYDV